MKKTALTIETVRQLLLALPGVEEGTSYGTRAFRVRKKLLARLLEDNETLVVKCADRDPWLAADPQAFYVTKHYLNYPVILVRLAKVRRLMLRELLEQAWRSIAPAKLIKLHESGSYRPPPITPLAELPQPKISTAKSLARVRKLCLALPEVEEKEAWSAPYFRVRRKMFAIYLNNHHGDGRIALWLKAPPGVQEMLVEAAPEQFFIPPYQGAFGWVGVDLEHSSDEEIAALVRQAYCLVAPKKLQVQLHSQTRN
jgi:hypothetical protein